MTYPNFPRPYAAPSIALLVAAILQGCCTHSTCDCEATETDESEQHQFAVEDLSLWVDGSGEFIGDCAEACQVYEPTDLRCELDAVEHLEPAPAGGGAGGQVPAESEAILHITCNYTEVFYCEGRRHACWTSRPRGAGTSSVGAWLGRAASAEAGSVESFRCLADELERRGAPGSLVARARDAARDEIAHAALMNELARRHGGSCERITTARTEERSLFALALENAIEGCTHETFAALVALHQAEYATDPRIAACMKRIATDELRHGQLAWDLHGWLLDQLSADEARAVERARLAALDRLGDVPDQDQLDAVTRSVLGLPARNVLAQLAGRLAKALPRAA